MKILIKSIFRYYSYMFYILIVIVLGFFYIVFDISSHLKQKTQEDIKILEKELAQIRRLEIYIQKLDKFVKENNIKPVSKDKAYKILLNTTDFLIKNFNAKVKSGIKEEENALIVKVEINSTLDEKLKKFLEYSTRTYSPIYKLEELKLKNKFLKLKFSIIQPFKEENA